MIFVETMDGERAECVKSADNGFWLKLITEEAPVLSQGLSLFQNQQGEFG